MGSILKRSLKSGSTAYVGQIILSRNGAIAHRESKSFKLRREASAWILERENEIRRTGIEATPSGPQLTEVIDRYITESQRAMGKTKAQVLRTIKTMAIAELRCGKIKSPDVVDFAQEVAQRGAQPQTVQNYLSHLGSVFAIARAAWGYPLDPAAMSDGVMVCKRLGITSKSRQRDRRPTIDELDRLLAHFDEIRHKRRDSNPMRDICIFALFSTRRQEEITLLKWSDFDVEHGRILVRDMKHPGQKQGNDQWVDLPPEAVAVIQRQPRTSERIFPASTDAISAAFTRACQFLQIEDLTFHDLRHEGISRLFEMGWNIPHTATVSGHRSWQSLKRYTHIRQKGDKYAGWKWTPADSA